MKPMFKAVIALAILAHPIDIIARNSYLADHQAEAHAYTKSDAAALTALIEKPEPDILAIGRRNALAKVKHPLTEAQASEAMLMLFSEPRP